MNERSRTDQQLAEEARLWDERKLTPSGWEDAPEAVPRSSESATISIRLPRQMAAILTEFARRAGVSHEVLIKQWLDDRIRQEADPQRVLKE